MLQSIPRTEDRDQDHSEELLESLLDRLREYPNELVLLQNAGKLLTQRGKIKQAVNISSAPQK
jgi:hypothetical protein